MRAFLEKITGVTDQKKSDELLRKGAETTEEARMPLSETKKMVSDAKGRNAQMRKKVTEKFGKPAGGNASSEAKIETLSITPEELAAAEAEGKKSGPPTPVKEAMLPGYQYIQILRDSLDPASSTLLSLDVRKAMRETLTEWSVQHPSKKSVGSMATIMTTLSKSKESKELLRPEALEALVKKVTNDSANCEKIISDLRKWNPENESLKVVKDEFIAKINAGEMTAAELDKIPEKLLEITSSISTYSEPSKKKLFGENTEQNSLSSKIFQSISASNRESDVSEDKLSSLEKAILTISETERSAEKYPKLTRELDRFFDYIKHKAEGSNSSGLKEMREIANDDKRSSLEKFSDIVAIAQNKKSGGVAEWYSHSHVFGKGRSEEVDTLYKNIVEAGKAGGIDRLCQDLDACCAPAPSKTADVSALKP